MRRLETDSLVDNSLDLYEQDGFVADFGRSQIYLVSPSSALHSWRYQIVKRGIDILGALAMLAISILPAVLIAAAIRLTSRGSIFYRETRIGRDGKPFRIFKFRSMSDHSTRRRGPEVAFPGETPLHWRVYKRKSDPRITAVGCFLRRWSLDELPQILNVLRGDMSLVGPRPVIQAEIALYGNLRDFYLAATPGLSGLWQVSGRSNVDFAMRAQLDASYVRRWCLRNDFAILLKTVPAVLGRVGAC